MRTITLLACVVVGVCLLSNWVECQSSTDSTEAASTTPASGDTTAAAASGGKKLTERLAKIAGLNKRHADAADPLHTNTSSLAGSRMNSIPNAQLNVDLTALDKLVSSLLEQHAAGATGQAGSLDSGSRTPPLQQRQPSKKLNRWRPLSRSAHSYKRGNNSEAMSGISFTQLQERSEQHAPNMPTIMESSAGSAMQANNNQSQQQEQQSQNYNAWTASLERTPGAVRNMLHSITQAGNPLNAAVAVEEDQLNLTQNYVG